jgi:hypothetical protein
VEYPLMVPPFVIKNFEKMSVREAQTHFDWYVSEIPERIELIRKAYKETDDGEIEELDFTPESLVNVWAWFIPRIITVPKSEEEIAEELRNSPDWLKDTIMKNNKKLSTGTLSLGMDIAIYFGEIFIKNFEGLTWGFVTKPKSLAYVNRPVILGFRTGVELDPRDLVYNLTLDVVDGNKNKNELYDLFEIWKEDI